MRIASACFFLLLSLLPAALPAQAPESHVQARLLAETTALLRGGETTLALELEPEPGWHTYWLNPGDSGTATALSWTLPQGMSAGDIQWPLPSAIALEGLVNYGYSGTTLHLVNVSVPADVPSGAAFTLKAEAKWLACKEICIPGSALLNISLPVADSVELDAANAAAFDATRALLPQATEAQARFAITDGAFSLAVQGAEFGSAAVAEFFPVAGDLVNHAAPQRLALEAQQGLRLTQALSSYFSKAPSAVQGLLVLTDTQGARRGFLLDASAGAVQAVPVTAAAELAAPLPPAAVAAQPQAVTWPLALGFALLGGLILNLMPCVFPVLSLKAYAVMGAQNAARGTQQAQALAYTAGTVLSCVGAAGALLALRAGGEALGWGFQLQSPAFITAMLYLLLALGLAMSGVLELGVGLMNTGSGLAQKQGLAGSFFTGVLAVVVASPCTAPFMGSALGFAITQPLLVALSIFAALGLGLALPFLALGFFPALASKLPRPGAWMETFKQAMAFPLYLTCAWLAWVLTRQAGADALGLAAVGLVAVALAVWLWGRQPRGPVATGIAVLAMAGAAATLASPLLRPQAASAAVVAAEAAEEGREPWSAARVAALQQQGRTVFVNFTADWCITCKVNERGALKSDAVHAAMKASNTVWLTGDWTRADPAITAELARFARNGVPLYLVYAKGGEPQVLPQVLTPQIIIDALNP